MDSIRLILITFILAATAHAQTTTLRKPAGAVSDNGAIRFDGTGGATVQTSNLIINDDGSIDIGGTDSTLARAGAGVLTIEGNTIQTTASSGDVTKVGTPVNNQVGVWTGDGTLEGDTALTFDTTTDALYIGALVNLGHASDTTVARASAGLLSVEGVEIPTISSTSTLTNKTLTTPVIDKIVTSMSGATLIEVVDGSLFEDFTRIYAPDGGIFIEADLDAADVTIGDAGGTYDLDLSVTGLTWNGVDMLTVSSASSLTSKNLTSATNTFPSSLLTETGVQTATNKTFTAPVLNSPALSADSVDAITEIAAGLKSGADATLLTGTATTDKIPVFNSDGDLVTSGYETADFLGGGVVTPIALPADGALTGNNSYYEDSLAATDTWTLEAAATEGEEIWLNVINAADTTITFATPKPYRAGSSGQITTMNLPAGNNSVKATFSNSKWRLADSGVDEEAANLLYASPNASGGEPTFRALVIGDIADDILTVAKQADGDWGDFTIATNSATLDANTVAANEIVDDSVLVAKIGDEDWGDFTIASNAASLDTGVVGDTQLATDSPTDGQYLTWNTGGTLTWETAAGSGDMLQSTYDTDTNDYVDASETVVIEVNNDSGAQIDDGDVVYISGFDIPSDLPEITPADSDAAGTMPAIGIANGDIANGADGEVIIAGIWEGDTTAFSVLDALYVSGTAGELTTTEPVGAALIQKIGVVARDHVTVGQIVVNGAGRTNAIPNFTAADKYWYGGTSGVKTEGAITAAGRAILDDANAAAQITTLGAMSTDNTVTATNKTIKNSDNTMQIYTEAHGSSHTIDATECYGGCHYATGAATITLPAVATGMSVSILTVGAVAVSVDPNGSDKIWLDGTAMDDGDKATNLSTSGDIIVLTYYSADGWYAASNSWTDGGP